MENQYKGVPAVKHMDWNTMSISMLLYGNMNTDVSG